MRTLILLTISTLLLSCKSELTPEKALEQLRALPEFTAPYYAPFHIGKEILSSEDHLNPDRYIKEHLGELINAGLARATIAEKNSWRTVLIIELTEAGIALSDPSRSNDKTVFVEVCRITPTLVNELRVIVPDAEIVADFTFTQNQITPFGRHLGFEDGLKHNDSRTFIRSGGGWGVQLSSVK